jgi:hypothetical protein
VAVNDSFLHVYRRPEEALRALVIIANTDAALRGESVSPEATEINIGLRHLCMSKKEPCTEDWLGKNVKYGIGNNLLVDIEDKRSVSDGPDAVKILELFKTSHRLNDSHRVSSP